MSPKNCKKKNDDKFGSNWHKLEFLGLGVKQDQVSGVLSDPRIWLKGSNAKVHGRVCHSGYKQKKNT